MCFSAEVSFGASAVITTVGALAIKKSKSKEQLLFAMIPLLFGIQQFCEGWLWLALENEKLGHLAGVSTYGFLIFAQLIWPVWVPLSIYVLEKNTIRKRLLGFSLATGVVLFAVLAYRMVFYEVSAQIDQHHIFYTVGHFQSTNWWSGILYLLPAAFPFVFSSNNHINYMGILMLLLFVVSKVFYLKYMISTWCLFAALLSVYIYFIVKKQQGTIS
ncbi:DUF6629 family protein [Carboxylicivirga sp. M1479]|uniref:DUF6629 family protein n=1 Tax=Carboxylicivirga sp. M1479 TaxID=2594476 RepID=UPI00117887CD|nr:DUF6629 family protein [Carboxylicivirga sp. M1479]TRX65694.1 hypothetical protein FNN09_17325 [Carboxylicivirga sp. M1479]